MEKSVQDRIAERQAHQRRQQKRTRLTLVSVAVALIAIAVIAAPRFIGGQEAASQEAQTYDGPLAPVNRDADGSIVMANDGVRGPVLEIFEDFQCPTCKAFEEASRDLLKRLAFQGKIKVVFHLFQWFEQEPMASNSRRAANAAACTQDDTWLSYSQTLFGYQPREGSEGFADKDLISWARDLGFGDAAFQTCVEDQQKIGQVEQMSRQAKQSRQVRGTPTVLLNGKAVDLEKLFDPSGLEKAILAAAASS